MCIRDSSSGGAGREVRDDRPGPQPEPLDVHGGAPSGGGLPRAVLVRPEACLLYTSAAAISTEALDGEPLDVVWNLTLAANLISANVPYGKMEAIRELSGVQDVILETRYAPCVVDREEAADPNMEMCIRDRS